MANEQNASGAQVPCISLLERPPTEAEINDACLSYRHDFGLLPELEKEGLRFDAREWLLAWAKVSWAIYRSNVARVSSGAAADRLRSDDAGTRPRHTGRALRPASITAETSAAQGVKHGPT